MTDLVVTFGVVRCVPQIVFYHRRTFKMKRYTRIALSLLLVTIVSVSAFGFIAAQDDMMTHTCDSTLITLLLIAEYDYGFTSESMDLSTFEGQYAPFFEAMMAMMEDDMMEDDMADDEMMEDEMADDEMMDDEMMMLPVGNIEGEDEACTALREELNAFFYDTFSMMMMEDMEEGQ
jgi:hypothetical protein